MAFLHASGDPHLAPQMQRHLDNCPSCLAFYREQSELTALFESPDLEVTPPEHLWYRIEDRLLVPQSDPQGESRTSAFVQLFAFWQFPAVRYAVLSLLLLLVASATLLDLGEKARTDETLLARLDAYHVSVEGNPFLGEPTRAVADNPFFSIDTSAVNPFRAKGSLK